MINNSRDLKEEKLEESSEDFDRKMEKVKKALKNSLLATLFYGIYSIVFFVLSFNAQGFGKIGFFIVAIIAFTVTVMAYCNYEVLMNIWSLERLIKNKE